MNFASWWLLIVVGVAAGCSVPHSIAGAQVPTTTVKTGRSTRSAANNPSSTAPSASSVSARSSLPPSHPATARNHSQASPLSQAPIEHLPALVWFGPTTHRSVYITIDDGWFPSRRVLRLMRRTHLPITAFLIKDAVQEHLAYWKAFVAAGGIIEDHTVSHPPLTSVSPAEMYDQWRTPVVDYKAWFGATPTLGRPPYGAVNHEVLQEAVRAGLQHVIMWSATMDQQGLQTWNHGPLEPGDIVLLHWDPGLYPELVQLLATIHADHLTPASLPAALSRGNKG